MMFKLKQYRQFSTNKSKVLIETHDLHALLASKPESLSILNATYAI